MRDLTKGPIIKSLVALAVPIVLTNLLHSAYQLIDTFWVGRLGANAVAAVSLSFPIIFLMITLGGGFTIAGTILVAQYKGRKDQKQVDHIASQTIVLMLLVSVIISILGFLISRPAMQLLGAEPAVLEDSVSYLKISFIGTIFMFSFFLFQSLMRGIGEVKLPLYVVFSTVMLNLFLDPLFIMGFGPIPAMGVTGAAMATIFTQGIATLIGFIILFSGKYGISPNIKAFKFDPKLMKKMFLLGLPSSIEQSMKALGLTVMSFLVATFGTITIAAYGIGIRVLSFVIIPAFGLAMATSTLVGQNFGAGKINRAEKIAKKSLGLILIALFLLGALTAIFSSQLAAAFIPGETEVIKSASIFIKFQGAAFAFIGAQLVLNAVFSGAGNTKISMIFSIVTLWVFEFPISYILSKHTELGELGIWIAVPVASILASIASYTYFKLGRWKNTKLLDAQDEEEKLEDAVRKETMIEEPFNS